MLRCPFCGAPETDRFEIEGEGFLVFGCMFAPSIDLHRPDDEIAARLRAEYGTQGSAYFRHMCDRLHLVVAQPTAAEPGAAGPTRSES